MFFTDKISSFFFLTLFFINTASSTIFTIINECNYTVWPGLLSGAGSAPLPTNGFSLNSSESRLISIPTPWSGRIFGRTGCKITTTGKLVCATGCDSSQIECSGAGPNHPVTVAEFKLNGTGSFDLYDVSFANGSNLPITIIPNGGFGNCNPVGCAADLNHVCPDELKVTVEEVGETAMVACRSACEVFRSPEYCCTVEFGAPDTCTPNEYSVLFKEACQTANQNAYDVKKPSTCSGSDFTITFCPVPIASVKNSTSVSLQQKAVSVSAASPTLSVALSFGISAVAVYWVRSEIW